MLHLGGIDFVHVEEVRHGGVCDRTAIDWRHGHCASEHLERSAVPIFLHLVQGGEAGIDESLQIGPDRLATVPVGDA